jgi:peptidoglycan/xylan/chitin deacetylase (PgdA/CDA1 family)
VKLRARIAVFLSVSVGCALGVYVLFRSGEPEFEGKRLSDWLRDLETHPDMASRDWKEASHAVRQIGSNAVPSLVRMIEVGDSKWKLQAVDWLQEAVSVDLTETLANVHNRRALLGFHLLGRDAASAAPKLQALIANSDPQIAGQALAALSEIGGEEVLPALLNTLTNGKPAVRIQAAATLGALRSRAGAAVPALVEATRDDDPGFRANAARALGEISLQADTAVPRLTEMLSDTNSSVRISAAMSLGAFGTQAEAALPAMLALPRDFDDSSTRAISRAMLRIQCEMRDGGFIRGPKTSRRIAFVFTGHEYAEGGETILNELARHNGHGSFFLTGVFLANTNHDPLVSRIISEGHYLGPHSDRHLLYCAWEDGRTLVTEDEFISDLRANVERIPGRSDERPFNRYFLPAFEHYNREIADWARKSRWTPVNFTPGTRSNADYTGEADKNFVSSQTIFDSILGKERDDPNGLNGFLLLLHLGSGPGRADKFHIHFGELLDELRAREYEFVRVDQLFGARTPIAYRSAQPSQPAK